MWLRSVLTHDETSDVKAVYVEWNQPWTVYELVLKKSASELDPRRFNPLGRKKFDGSDTAEWAQWIKNKVTTSVPERMESRTEKKKVISVPMTYVRTSRSKIQVS